MQCLRREKLVFVVIFIHMTTVRYFCNNNKVGLHVTWFLFIEIMASAEIDPKIIKATQDILGKVISKPPLTEKLLKRPPFKYLHDIITSVVRTTGFMRELYKDEELVVDNIKDKEAKIAFLEKSIDFLGFLTENPLNVKASKVVAGLEADKTNEYLQVLGKSVALKRDSSAAIQKVLKGEKPQKGKAKTLAPKAVGRTKAAARSASPAAKKPDLKAGSSANGKPKSPRNASADKGGASGAETKKPLKEVVPSETNEPQSTLTQQADVPSPKPEAEAEMNAPTPRPRTGRASGVKAVPQVTVRPPTGATPSTSEAMDEEDEKKDDEPAPRVVRPTTARAAPPKVVKKREIEEDREAEEERMRLLSAKPVENLITESDLNANDDETFVVEEVKGSDEQENPDVVLKTQLGSVEAADVEKGSLVKQLMETKKELEGDKDVDILKTMDESFDKLANRDVEKLRENIQALTRLANPLGRVLDYLQEDIDSMTSELRTWEEEYKLNMTKLEKEKNTKDHDAEALLKELDDLDRDIAEEMESIGVTKANLIKNEQKILRMVEMVVEK